MTKERANQSVRIISGKFRGRKLQFPESPGLRPTLGRTRETLFNWLAPHLVGSQCLDLFAGSGALGFEALSRGAATVVFVEQQRRVCQALRDSAQQLGLTASEHQIVQQHSTEYLPHCASSGQGFDLIFLDPPFSLPLLQQAIDQIVASALLRPAGQIYYECAAGSAFEHPGLVSHRHRSSGDYQYGLLQLP